MPQLTETGDALEIQSLMHPGLRAVLLLVALFPLAAPYELLVRPRWESIWNIYFLFMAVISLGALLVTTIFAMTALAGLSSVMRFDRSSGLFSYTAHAPIVPRRKKEYPLGSIQAVEVDAHEWSEGPPSYSLRVRMVDGVVFSSGSESKKEEVEEMKGRVDRFLEITRRF